MIAVEKQNKILIVKKYSGRDGVKEENAQANHSPHI